MTSSPLFRTGALISFLGVLLAVDTQVDAHAQLLLGLAAWVVLALALRGVSPLLRVQALVVVVVATCAEIVGSLIWGVYTYRLENLPSFVPPCHGLVYLAGASLAVWAAPWRTAFVRVALVAVLAWGIAGVTVLPRMDVGGAIGAGILAVYLVRGRAPEVYAGVFLVVAWLRALRHRDRHVGVGGRHPRDRHTAGQPAERCRVRLRLVRHRRPRVCPAAAQAGRASSGGSGLAWTTTSVFVARVSAT